MNGMWKSFEELSPLTFCPATKGRLIRCYKVPLQADKREFKSLECLFHDEEGVRFHFTVQKNAISQFESLFHEGETYGLRNFVVTHNIVKPRLTSHRYKALILGTTKVRVENDENFPRQIFSFKSFQEIAATDVAQAIPFDVIGRVVYRSDPKEITIIKTGKKKMIIDLTLENIEGERLSCTLWEDYVEKCMKEYDKHMQEVNIVILQLCNATLFQGGVKVNNGYDHTKILLNHDVPEILEFRQRLVLSSSLSTTVIGSSSQGTISTTTGELSAGDIILSTIVQLGESKEGGIFWICGTVMNFDANEGWCYIGCKKCHSKMNKMDSRFYCKKCVSHNDSGTIMYKLVIHVADNSGSSPFLLWDREASQAIG